MVSCMVFCDLCMIHWKHSFISLLAMSLPALEWFSCCALFHFVVSYLRISFPRPRIFLFSGISCLCVSIGNDSSHAYDLLPVCCWCSWGMPTSVCLTHANLSHLSFLRTHLTFHARMCHSVERIFAHEIPPWGCALRKLFFRLYRANDVRFPWTCLVFKH